MAEPVDPIPADEVQAVALAVLVTPTLRRWARPGPKTTSLMGWALAHELQSGVDMNQWARWTFQTRGRPTRLTTSSVA
jgi:hypothetical protein